ncbi:hypothetical protein CSC70_02165 [Pseudoxanthomonas kalamensis DSM 18571]|uniref:anti-sigma factor family protein n=1 Tax=Pseudoxanthomonas kalamensis TaxID=289483 RepID=UPI0013910625|nr:anti-sigma factor [Pseudoxanthomonas kalamensis]KAF1712349.1 hypothetical protein CSC70_02165 [Pseudoxanthomonas kalamensis DSM 18571]
MTGGPKSFQPGEDELHAYVDGRLDAVRRAEINAWLEANPLHAAQVRGWKRDAERLRALHAYPEAWPANPQLEPARVRHGLRKRRWRRLGMTASLMFSLALGTGAGWYARQTSLPMTHPPMADAVAAYRQFVDADAPPMEFGNDRVDDLQRWLQRHYGNEGSVPDLGAAGYHLLGGRLLSTEQGVAAMLVYQDGSGARVGVYLRPRGQLRSSGRRRDGNLLAQYWSRHDTSFAVVSAVADTAALQLPRMLGSD